MQVPCTYCGAALITETKRSGRPSAFCGETCKSKAKRDPSRICRTCGKKFTKSLQLPFHCSDECRTSIDRGCLQCGRDTPPESRFCSGNCVMAHAGNPQCAQCTGQIPPPDSPPYSRTPRYCSPECRSVSAVEKGHSKTRVASQYTELCTALYYDMSPVKLQLPTAGEYKPFRIPAPLAPSINEDHTVEIRAEGKRHTVKFSSKVVDSIAFWNMAIPKFSDLTDPVTALARLGRTGLAPDQPHGIRPLVECWPWVRTPFDKRNVLEQWTGARESLRYTAAQIAQKRNFIQQLIDEYRVYLGVADAPRVQAIEGDNTAAWRAQRRRMDSRAKKYFRKDATGKSRLVQEIELYQAMHQPPQNSRFLMPAQVDFLESDEFWDFQAKLAKMLTGSARRKWQVGDYTTDPPPLRDRFTEEIEQIKEQERVQGSLSS